MARGSAFSTPPPKSRGAPQSLKQVTGEAVTLEGTSNRDQWTMLCFPEPERL